MTPQTQSPPPPSGIAGPAGAPKTVLVVDDHPLMREGLLHLIARESDLALAGEAGSPAEALAFLAKGRPDLILADISMPGRAGLDFIKDVLALDPTRLILVVSAHDEMLFAERALQAGARGYVMKDAGGEQTLAAIRQVLGGEIYVSPRVSAQLLEQVSARARRRPSDSPIGRLTDREFEVFRLIGQGASVQAIADRLHLSAKTIESHRANIRMKLELPDAAALARYAVRWVETI
jgi:DNA-binding NarL/FixJ family response regulator